MSFSSSCFVNTALYGLSRKVNCLFWHNDRESMHLNEVIASVPSPDISKLLCFSCGKLSNQVIGFPEIMFHMERSSTARNKVNIQI